jgi:hypothetical protein
MSNKNWTEVDDCDVTDDTVDATTPQNACGLDNDGKCNVAACDTTRQPWRAALQTFLFFFTQQFQKSSTTSSYIFVCERQRKREQERALKFAPGYVTPCLVSFFQLFQS